MSGSNFAGRFARTTSSMIHLVTPGNTMTISVPKMAHASVPAASHGYRFRYPNTRQTVFIGQSTSSAVAPRQGKHSFLTGASGGQHVQFPWPAAYAFADRL